MTFLPQSTSRIAQTYFGRISIYTGKYLNEWDKYVGPSFYPDSSKKEAFEHHVKVSSNDSDIFEPEKYELLFFDYEEKPLTWFKDVWEGNISYRKAVALDKSKGRYQDRKAMMFITNKDTPDLDRFRRFKKYGQDAKKSPAELLISLAKTMFNIFTSTDDWVETSGASFNGLPERYKTNLNGDSLTTDYSYRTLKTQPTILDDYNPSLN